ncbi:MAG: hypothetical protein ACLQPD_35630 [Desulfomonilaceae bacterium]
MSGQSATGDLLLLDTREFIGLLEKTADRAVRVGKAEAKEEGEQVHSNMFPEWRRLRN